MNDNDSKRGAIYKSYKGVGNVEDTIANATLEANGMHAMYKNNSTCKHVELV